VTTELTTPAPIRTAEYENLRFLEALDMVAPSAPTACTEWTVHDLTAHIAAGADEMTLLFEAFMEGKPIPAARPFAEREAPYRAMDDAALRRHAEVAVARSTRTILAGMAVDPDIAISMGSDPMRGDTFLMHGRSELSIHRWDLVGDDDVSLELLSQPELTTHAVEMMGQALLLRGCANSAPVTRFDVRLRTAGVRDIVVTRAQDGASLSFDDPDTSPAIHADAAARLLFVWGRRPADRSRLRSDLPAEQYAAVESLLAGF
jgi:uncharacterized protein (TIGR03083 family)